MAEARRLGLIPRQWISTGEADDEKNLVLPFGSHAYTIWTAEIAMRAAIVLILAMVDEW
jgi:hypothetical protein